MSWRASLRSFRDALHLNRLVSRKPVGRKLQKRRRSHQQSEQVGLPLNEVPQSGQRSQSHYTAVQEAATSAEWGLPRQSASVLATPDAYGDNIPARPTEDPESYLDSSGQDGANQPPTCAPNDNENVNERTTEDAGQLSIDLGQDDADQPPICVPDVHESNNERPHYIAPPGDMPDMVNPRLTEPGHITLDENREEGNACDKKILESQRKEQLLTPSKRGDGQSNGADVSRVNVPNTSADGETLKDDQAPQSNDMGGTFIHGPLNNADETFNTDLGERVEVPSVTRTSSLYETSIPSSPRRNWIEYVSVYGSQGSRGSFYRDQWQEALQPSRANDRAEDKVGSESNTGVGNKHDVGKVDRKTNPWLHVAYQRPPQPLRLSRSRSPEESAIVNNRIRSDLKPSKAPGEVPSAKNTPETLSTDERQVFRGSMSTLGEEELLPRGLLSIPPDPSRHEFPVNTAHSPPQDTAPPRALPNPPQHHLPVNTTHSLLKDTTPLPVLPNQPPHQPPVGTGQLSRPVAAEWGFVPPQAHLLSAGEHSAQPLRAIEAQISKSAPAKVRRASINQLVRRELQVVKAIGLESDPDEIQLVKNRCQGRNAEVYVVKTVNLERTNDQSVRAMPSEFALHSFVSMHKNIVRTYGAWADTNIDGMISWHIAMEYCTEGDVKALQKHVSNCGERIHRMFMLYFMASVTEALAFLHCGLYIKADSDFKDVSTIFEDEDLRLKYDPIIHRDLKLCNVFLRWAHPSRRRYGMPDILLGDFGLATNAAVSTGHCGTPGYFAPEYYVAELLRADNRDNSELRVDPELLRTPVPRMTTATDIYCLGVCMYALGRVDFDESHFGPKGYMKGDLNEALNSSPIRSDFPLRFTIVDCLSFEPRDRPKSATLYYNAKMLHRQLRLMYDLGHRVPEFYWRNKPLDQ